MLSEEGQPVCQKRRIAPAHTLDANTGCTKAGRGGLHSHTAHLVQHHADVAGSHGQLFVDLVLANDLDVQWGVLQSYVRASRIYRDLFFLGLFGLQLHFNCGLLRGLDGYGRVS